MKAQKGYTLSLTLALDGGEGQCNASATLPLGRSSSTHCRTGT